MIPLIALRFPGFKLIEKIVSMETVSVYTNCHEAGDRT
jgi:hypothetical protein